MAAGNKPTQEKLQKLWDRLFPNEPRTITKAHVTGYKGSKHVRLVWIGERKVDGEPSYIELGARADDAADEIRRRARRAGNAPKPSVSFSP